MPKQRLWVAGLFLPLKTASYCSSDSGKTVHMKMALLPLLISWSPSKVSACDGRLKTANACNIKLELQQLLDVTDILLALCPKIQL